MSKYSKRPTNISLESVKLDFVEWRKSKPNKNSKIPNSLWKKVVKLIDYYGVGKIAATLSLSGKQLNKKIKELKQNKIQNKNKPSVLPKSNGNLNSTDFLELPLPPIFSKNITTTKIEIHSIDGAKLCVNCTSNIHISNIINYFLGRDCSKCYY